jgi:hypothetical protein
LITFLVGKLRKIMNLHTLRLLNKIVGSIIIVSSVYYLWLTIHHSSFF